MDLNSVRRASSAGYRLPERRSGTRPKSSEPSGERKRRSKREAVTIEPNPEPNPDRTDSVKRDQMWKDLVLNERRGAQEWEKNWGFLRKYDQMGQLKPEEPNLSATSFSCERVPKTSNHTIGSRLATPLGTELVRLDRLLLRSGSHRKHKQDPEFVPC
ncbi:uncharacterized protein C2orf50 homolog [Takifugu flavidus]|uniref:Uncharacterized protein n=1 Tax=Takifugu flavidus TaxID=433684 RepID=A0A5C6P0R6_9TELE|nr:uncharacterized protein C2orf50 homolog [Takifugu flavidus]TWW71690.1 hypothetical protein D4764_16G0001870 [Takifugu flavidus]